MPLVIIKLGDQGNLRQLIHKKDYFLSPTLGPHGAGELDGGGERDRCGGGAGANAAAAEWQWTGQADRKQF